MSWLHKESRAKEAGAKYTESLEWNKSADSSHFLLNKYFLKLHCLFSENIHQIPTLNYLFLVPSRSTWVEMGVLGFLQLLKKKKDFVCVLKGIVNFPSFTSFSHWTIVQ